MKTLGQILDEIEDALTQCRKAMIVEKGDSKLTMNYDKLLKEKEATLKKISKYGRDYVEGANTTPTRRGIKVRRASW